MRRNGQASFDERLDIAVFCGNVGWTYEQYLTQPKWFIALLKLKLEEDHKGK